MRCAKALPFTLLVKKKEKKVSKYGGEAKSVQPWQAKVKLAKRSENEKSNHGPEDETHPISSSPPLAIRSEITLPIQRLHERGREGGR